MLSLVRSMTADADEQREDARSKQRFQLARLLRSTEEILHCAQIADWESVEILERQRQAELTACFAGDDEDSSPLIAEALATLLHMNNQITDLVKKAKADLVAEQQKIENQKSAANHYQDKFQI